MVEEEHTTRQLFRRSLQSAGFTVLTCTEGTRALQIATTIGFDLIIIDSVLAGLDGATVCRRIRNGGSSADSAVLMVSASGSESDTVLALDSGADDSTRVPGARGARCYAGTYESGVPRQRSFKEDRCSSMFTGGLPPCGISRST